MSWVRVPSSAYTKRERPEGFLPFCVHWKAGLNSENHGFQPLMLIRPRPTGPHPCGANRCAVCPIALTAVGRFVGWACRWQAQPPRRQRQLWRVSARRADEGGRPRRGSPIIRLHKKGEARRVSPFLCTLEGGPQLGESRLSAADVDSAPPHGASPLRGKPLRGLSNRPYGRRALCGLGLPVASPAPSPPKATLAGIRAQRGRGGRPRRGSPMAQIRRDSTPKKRFGKQGAAGLFVEVVVSEAVDT